MRLALVFLMVATGGAIAQIEAEVEPEVEAETVEEASPPTLDELLGLDDPQESRESDRELPINDPTKNELDRRLDGKQVNEVFVQAVELMGETAQRLDGGRDTGITTQRLQESILRKLDQVLESAQSNQSQSSSSSSDSPQDQPQQQQQNSSQQSSSSNDSKDAPPRQDGQLGAAGSANAASWGSLRARIRDALTQGTTDPFSSIYRSMTEDFYKRLAEEQGR